MNRNLTLLALSLFTWGVGEGLFLYFQPVYLEQLGADPVRIGAILSGFGVAMTAALIPAGYLADRFGRRQMIWAAWGLGLAATLIMALATTLTVFATGLLIYGLTFFVMSPLNSYITAARGQWSVGRAITVISACFNLGMVAGPLLGGYIGERYGLRSIFFVAAVIFVFSTAIILNIQAQPVEQPAHNRRRSDFLLNPAYRSYLALVFLVVFATHLPQPLSQNFLNSQRGLSIEQIGRLVSLTGLGVAILNLTLGKLPERIGFLLAQAAVGGFAILLWQGTSLPWYALGYFLLGGFKTLRALALAQTSTLIDAANMGLAYAVTDTIASAAIILAPLIAGLIFSVNPVSVYAWGAVLIAVSILVSIRFSPYSRTIVGQPAMAAED